MKQYLLVLTILMACKGETGPPGPALRGTMQGLVSLFTSSETQLPSNAGATVFLDGTSYLTTTDSSGKWILSDVQTGIYDIVFQKEGFFEERFVGTQFIGGGTLSLPHMTMLQLPDFLIPTFDLSNSSTDTIIASGTIFVLSPIGRAAIIFLDTTASVSYDPSQHIFGESARTDLDLSKFQRVIILDGPTKYRYGLQTGQKIYARAYPASGFGPFFYYDPITGKRLPQHFGTTPSPLDSAIVP